MALSAKVSNFTAKTGSTGSMAVTGVGFQPKASLFFNNRTTTPGDVAGAGINMGYSGQSAADLLGGYNSADNVATTDIVRSLRTNRIYESLPYGSSSADSACSLTTIGSDGWTFNFTAVAAAYKIPYMALGGSDITDSKGGSFLLNTSTGNQSVTGVGFQPDVVMFIFQSLGTSSGDSNADCCFGFGVAKSSTERWCSQLSGDSGVGTSNTRRSFHNDHCIVISNVNADTVNGSADFVSMDADGFTINVDDAPAAGYILTYLAIQGGEWAVGTETQKTSTGTKATTGLGLTPAGLLVCSAGHNTANSITPTARFSFGVSDGTNSEGTWFGDEDAVANTNCDSSYSTTNLLMFKDEAGGGSPTTLAEAELDSFDSDGFTLDWTTADSTARIFGYVAVGTPSGGTTGQVKVKISGSFVAKPIKVKASGTFTTKPMKFKSGGAFTETNY